MQLNDSTPQDQKIALDRLMRTVSGTIKTAILSGQPTKLKECAAILRHIQGIPLLAISLAHLLLGVLISLRSPPPTSISDLLNEPIGLCLAKVDSLERTNEYSDILLALTSAPFLRQYERVTTEVLQRVGSVFPQLDREETPQAERRWLFVSLHPTLRLLEELLCKNPYSAIEKAPWKR
jgi:hypothetical protein